MYKFPTSKAAEFLYKLGVNYHATGIIKNDDGQALFDYYKCDSLTDDQRDVLRERVPYVHFFGLQAQFAPEQRSVAVAFPKAAFFRNLEANRK